MLVGPPAETPVSSWCLEPRMSHLAWNFGSGPDDVYAATSFASLYLEPVTSPLAK